MNEHQARQEGLEYTGIYSFNKEEVKARIAKERKERPKARIILVRVPHSKLSRGGTGVGWAAYVDKYYKAYDLLEQFSERLQNHPSHVLSMLNRHEKERKDLEHKFQEYIKIVNDANEVLVN